MSIVHSNRHLRAPTRLRPVSLHTSGGTRDGFSFRECHILYCSIMKQSCFHLLATRSVASTFKASITWVVHLSRLLLSLVMESRENEHNYQTITKPNGSRLVAIGNTSKSGEYQPISHRALDRKRWCFVLR